ncbi:MAG TPA: DUF4160 domain-containing protein [Terriglobia bacterium]|nr:DUF4160 domain-containing protein [Terriglobia bacterium]
MPTVVRLNELRVVVYPNDHGPAHVHVIGRGHEAVFNLDCWAGPVDLRENYGFSGREIARIESGLTAPSQRVYSNAAIPAKAGIHWF